MTDGSNMIMPVAPTGSFGNGGFGGWGSDIWVILLVLFAFGGFGGSGGMGGFGGFGGFGNYDFPWLLASNANNQNSTQGGFNQLATNNAISALQSSITSGFGDVNLGIAGINQNTSNGFAQAEIANNARQMANMQQIFGLQSQLSQCCCDNRLATAQTQALVQSENCADRAALSDGIRDILTNQNAGIQKILDQLCQDKIDSKNEKIVELQNQLNMANLAASQTAQTARILSDNAAQTVALEQYLNPTPVPAYMVQNPNCCYNGYGYGCGCGCNA